MYGIEYKHIYDSQKGYRNEIWPVLSTDGKMLNVTFFKRESGIVGRINRADMVSKFLADNGIPARKRLDQRLLYLKSSTSITSICIYNYLPGNTIPWEAYTMSHIKQLGMTMSNMHSVLSNFHAENFPSVYDEYINIIEQIRKYFSDDYIVVAVRKKLGISVDVSRLEKYSQLLRKKILKPTQQVLHMDFVRGNILFDEKGNISGILDFEKTTIGHVVVDVARTLAFLLADCKYKPADKVYKYFLRSGYLKRGQTKVIGEKADLEILVEMFLVYDLYKFMRHNPYEFLNQNEHYIRTRDILVSRGVISLLVINEGSE